MRGALQGGWGGEVRALSPGAVPVAGAEMSISRTQWAGRREERATGRYWVGGGAGQVLRLLARERVGGERLDFVWRREAWAASVVARRAPAFPFGRTLVPT